MSRCCCGALLALVLTVGTAGAKTLVYEPQDWSTPRDGWLVDQDQPNKWNLWSTDSNAAAKWTGGVVLRGPALQQDVERPEDGAPPLHTVITGIPKGAYDVSLKVGRTLAVSLDGKEWRRYTGGLLLENWPCRDGRFEVWVDDRFASDPPGPCYYDAVLFDVAGGDFPVWPKVNGWATERVTERLDRGVVALPQDGVVYVSWRLLKDDPSDLCFNLYRQVGQGRAARVNAEPIRWTTDCVDTTAPAAETLLYSVRAVRDGVEQPETGWAVAGQAGRGLPYVSLRTEPGETFQRIGIADLNGDGRLDYVVKSPNANIDPAGSYWHRSEGTYQLTAYLHDGARLWQQDLGWGIEQGVWYSPFVVADLDGDGKAEVIAKYGGDGDPRDEDGRVTGGPEWAVVWDGQTGREVARVDWPTRDGIQSYNLQSRNQMAIAYLDGKTPCLVLLRGTYSLMKAETYQLVDGKLVSLWKYSSEPYGRRWQGQGAHFTHCADVDGDGRDEVLLGSAVIDDTGVPLWSTGYGHPDHFYYGDIDPLRPGLEIYYGIETRQQDHGMMEVDAATGKVLWFWNEPTTHVHATGMCSDVEPEVPGMECWSADSVAHDPTDRRWLWSAGGKVLTRELIHGFGVQTAYWDADLQREEVAGGTIKDHLGGKVAQGLEGSRILVADVLGDWREEVITSLPGELRIYSTAIPATDRRVCLMQDPIYRADVTNLSMGYTQQPMTSYCLDAVDPNLNLTCLIGENGEPEVRVVASAPLDQPLCGLLKLQADGLELSPSALTVDLKPGERLSQMVAIQAPGAEAVGTMVTGVLEGPERPLTGQVAVSIPSKPLSGVPLVQAEDIAAQGGGEVHLRDDKVGVLGQAFSHWDDEGHWLEWVLPVPAKGRYKLLVRYSSSYTPRRSLTVAGRELPAQVFPSSGGFGEQAEQWEHLTVCGTDGKPVSFELPAGDCRIRMENIDGHGLNLDYLALVPVK